MFTRTLHACTPAHGRIGESAIFFARWLSEAVRTTCLKTNVTGGPFYARLHTLLNSKFPQLGNSNQVNRRSSTVALRGDKLLLYVCLENVEHSRLS